jgi:hypothetical protein
MSSRRLQPPHGPRHALEGIGTQPRLATAGFLGDPAGHERSITGLPRRAQLGCSYVHNFLIAHLVPLLLAVASVWLGARHDRRHWLLPLTLLPTALYSYSVGGDNFTPFRFFAHVIPLVFVFALVGIHRISRHHVGRIAWYSTLAVVSLPHVPFEVLHEQIAGMSRNGDPKESVEAALLLRKNASPDASVAVIPAGIVPYFSRLRALDILGKSDRHIASLPYRPRAMLAHGKLDPEYTLARRPDHVWYRIWGFVRPTSKRGSSRRATR